MKLHTASEVISLARRLETESAALYVKLAECGGEADLMRSLSTENERSIVQIERAYYGVISDALESGFAFDVESDDFEMPARTVSGATVSGTVYADMLKAAIDAEARMVRFYGAAAEQSRSLLADMPRVFAQIARKHSARPGKLQALLEGSR